jgi:hypothetical protein
MIKLMIIFYKNQKFNLFTTNSYKININKNNNKILKKIKLLILLIKINKINSLKMVNNKKKAILIMNF